MAESTTSPGTTADLSRGALFGYGAAVWSFIFAIFHTIWAMGWYVGLDPVAASKAFSKTSFLIYDIVVAGICAFRHRNR